MQFVNLTDHAPVSDYFDKIGKEAEATYLDSNEQTVVLVTFSGHGITHNNLAACVLNSSLPSKCLLKIERLA